jgi:hypothetical protein
MGLSFTIDADPRQSIHSQIIVLRDSWPHFTVSDSRLPQPGGPDLRTYIPQEQGGPVIPPGTGFLFRRLLRLAGLRWRYSSPPPHGGRRYIDSARTTQKTLTCQNAWRGPHRKHHFLYCCKGMFTAPLPSKGSIRRRGNVFSDPLPSNGYTRYIIIIFPRCRTFISNFLLRRNGYNHSRNGMDTSL